jgi:ABC-type transport system substrate-binding protein
VVWGYHSTLEGWNSDWEKRFQDKYAYDPARARALLKEAGYPDGFKTTVVVTSLPGAPEMIDGAQALPLYLNKIGIEVKTVEMEFAKLRELYRAAKTHDLIYPIRGSYRPLEPTLRFYNISGKEGFHQVVPDNLLNVKYQQFINSVDGAERERVLKEIGEFKFINYTEIPIAWLPGQIVVNPKVVGEYIFPGNINGPLSHLEYVKPAQ